MPCFKYTYVQKQSKLWILKLIFFFLILGIALNVLKNIGHDYTLKTTLNIFKSKRQPWVKVNEENNFWIQIQKYIKLYIFPIIFLPQSSNIYNKIEYELCI